MDGGEALLKTGDQFVAEARLRSIHFLQDLEMNSYIT
jgi:hypothetical protein